MADNRLISKGDRITFLDGAMGTSLLAVGADPTPLSNLRTPEAVRDITALYIEAGTDIVETNTFSATSAKYDNYRELNTAGLKLARQALKSSGGKKVLIAGCVGPTGLMVRPVGKLDFEEAVGIFSSQIKILAGGADLLIIETMDDISEMRAALIAAGETAPGVPVIASMTFSDEREETVFTSTGTPAEAAARVMDSLGASVLGANCSFGPERMVKVIERMRRVTGKPVIAQANAGLPRIVKGKTVYRLGPGDYLKEVKGLLRAGASYIGGCCGTTPEHIGLLVRNLRGRKPPKPPEKRPLVICSRTGYLEISAGGFPAVIGERINFIAHKELKESDEKVIAEGLKQKNAGAKALDVNLGRYEERTADVVRILAERADLPPVVLDSQNPGQITKAARSYPGVMLLNSVSGEEKKMKELLPVAKKYGMPFIALCLDDKGVPKKKKRKLEVFGKIVKNAEKAGIDRNEIIADPLTFSMASSGYGAVQETLGTVRELNKKGINTVLGISNVSMGMLYRAEMNQTFCSLAVNEGCSALIVNPMDTELMEGIHNAALLSGKDPDFKRYLAYFKGNSRTFSFKHALPQAILEGNRAGAAREAARTLKKTPAMEMVDKYVLPALNKVGELFRTREIFLPQLVEAAQAAQAGMEIIEDRMRKEGTAIRKRGRIIIATVKGDIHDIGKNLVALILRNHSFDVKDMGVDVDSKKIVEEAAGWKADLIALSSLMTTTMDRMKEVREMLDRKKLRIPVIIGGAAINNKYAESIGAYYGKDAVEAAKVAGAVIRG
ncbi:MAG: homocysteine S-methyltransferase family protein [Elusimicrobia bacterium]|nr:homocysteine S-methyltransferase family protein [Elusimicrobiota bacterium]